jgi:hypothetical protein
MSELVVTTNQGLRNDKGRKFVPGEFFYEINNYNYDNLIGCDRINYPEISYTAAGTDGVDGIFQFRYVNNSSQLVKENILVINGSIIKDGVDSINTPTTIYTGLTKGHKCTFAILNDQLFISNGYDNILVYSNIDGNPIVKEMGSPYARLLTTTGNLNGAYYYACTYVIDSVELVTGTVSNTVNLSNNQVQLTIPVGPTDTSERKIYRTQAGGSVLKLLTTIGDNSTTTFTDNVADVDLGANMPTVNTPAPKPKFITVKDERLVGVGNNARPNYLYVSETEVEVLYNTIGVSDVSGQGNDYSSLTGLAVDYDQIVVFSEKNIYLVSLGTATTVRQTNVNVGCVDGFSIAKIPKNATFEGGLMFVSSEFDVRVFSGNIATTVATSLDNLKTTNFSAVLNKDELKTNFSGNDLHAEFYDYKYHLSTGTLMYVYDVRTLGWTNYRIITDSYAPSYRYLKNIENQLFAGQTNANIVEKFYQNLQYRSEDAVASFETPELLYSNTYKYIKEIHIYYGSSGNYTTTVTATPDNNSNLAFSESFSISSNGFDPDFFNPLYFETVTNVDDYKIMHINKYCRWIRFNFSSTGKFNFRGFKLIFDIIGNQEL